MLPTPYIGVSARLGKRVDLRLVTSLGHRARRAAQCLGLDTMQLHSLGLRVVDDLQMARLHREYMGERGPTDVLSFTPAQSCLPADRGVVLGDIVIDWDAVERQAASGSSRARLDEATVLLVHGLAHLIGHDHRDRGEGRRMHRVEQRVLRALRVPDPPRTYAPRLLRPGKIMNEEPA